MVQDDPQISSNRKALLGAYAALDTKRKLADELRHVGVEFDDGPLDPYSQLQTAAEGLDQQQPDNAVHRLHLAFAAMEVLRRGARPQDEARDQLRPVVESLINPEASRDDPDADPVAAVHSALDDAGGLKAEQDRWKQVNRRINQEANLDVSSSLHPELSGIEKGMLRSELRSVGDELVSLVETRFFVQHPRTLRQIAPALLPHNWKHCNDFFCDLIRRPERDSDCPGATGGNLTIDARHWRGVYEERVGKCPGGWFPDTFLLFTWDRSDGQLVLRYELAPRRRNDRTVIKIDEGYIQVDQLPGGYEVSTQKYLLFDDKFIPGGGQLLGRSAFELGWLDYAFNQFTSCAEDLSGDAPDLETPVPSDYTPVPEPPADIDDGLQQVLNRFEVNIRESVTDVNSQFGRFMNKMNSRTYGPNDIVSDWGKIAVRAVRDGSRAVESQIYFALKSLEIAQGSTRWKDPR